MRRFVRLSVKRWSQRSTFSFSWPRNKVGFTTVDSATTGVLIEAWAASSCLHICCCRWNICCWRSGISSESMIGSAKLSWLSRADLWTKGSVYSGYMSSLAVISSLTVSVWIVIDFLRDPDGIRGVVSSSSLSDSLPDVLWFSIMAGVGTDESPVWWLVEGLDWTAWVAAWKVVDELDCPAWAAASVKLAEYSFCKILGEAWVVWRGDPLESGVSSVLSFWWQEQWRSPVFEFKYCGGQGQTFRWSLCRCFVYFFP